MKLQSTVASPTDSLVVYERKRNCTEISTKFEFVFGTQYLLDVFMWGVYKTLIGESVSLFRRIDDGIPPYVGVVFENLLFYYITFTKAIPCNGFAYLPYESKGNLSLADSAIDYLCEGDTKCQYILPHNTHSRKRRKSKKSISKIRESQPMDEVTFLNKDFEFKSIVIYYKYDNLSKPIKSNVLYIPSSRREACYDAFFTHKDNFIVLQVTIAKNHKVKPKILADVATYFGFSKVHFVFVVCNFQQGKSSEISYQNFRRHLINAYDESGELFNKSNKNSDSKNQKEHTPGEFNSQKTQFVEIIQYKLGIPIHFSAKAMASTSTTKNRQILLGNNNNNNNNNNDDDDDDA